MPKDPQEKRNVLVKMFASAPKHTLFYTSIPRAIRHELKPLMDDSYVIEVRNGSATQYMLTEAGQRYARKLVQVTPMVNTARRIFVSNQLGAHMQAIDAERVTEETVEPVQAALYAIMPLFPGHPLRAVYVLEQVARALVRCDPLLNETADKEARCLGCGREGVRFQECPECGPVIDSILKEDADDADSSSTSHEG